jgi:hypothetical protein
MSIPKNRVRKLNPAHEDLHLFGPYSLNSLRFGFHMINSIDVNSPAQPRICYIKLMQGVERTIHEYQNRTRNLKAV